MTKTPHVKREDLREPLLTGALRLGAVAAAMRAVKAEDADTPARKPAPQPKKAA